MRRAERLKAQANLIDYDLEPVVRSIVRASRRVSAPRMVVLSVPDELWR